MRVVRAGHGLEQRCRGKEQDPAQEHPTEADQPAQPGRVIGLPENGHPRAAERQNDDVRGDVGDSRQATHIDHSSKLTGAPWTAGSGSTARTRPATCTRPPSSRPAHCDRSSTCREQDRPHAAFLGLSRLGVRLIDRRPSSPYRLIDVVQSRPGRAVERRLRLAETHRDAGKVVALSRQPSLELLHRCSPRGGLLVRLRLPRCFLAANIGKSARHLGALSPTHGGPRQHQCVGCSLACQRRVNPDHRVPVEMLADIEKSLLTDS
ncbi:MAG: hypothetical protein QOE30_3920 [Mycobacterium sp.]|nr:hypothetical protein [Mycobacterium sp.]